MKGKRLLEKVKERFPETHSTSHDWLQAWRNLAAMTGGITKDDWRFPGIMDLLNGCDKAFESGNWAAFQRLAERVKALCLRK